MCCTDFECGRTELEPGMGLRGSLGLIWGNFEVEMEFEGILGGENVLF